MECGIGAMSFDIVAKETVGNEPNRRERCYELENVASV